MSSADSGAGTLRQAISDAASGDTINFAANITTITLTSGELLIQKFLTISGPGADVLTVQRSSVAGTPAFRIFDILGFYNVVISGLKITNGLASFGGGISNTDGNVTIANCTISGNSVTDSGGGIHSQISFGGGASMTITNCTISGNFANIGGSALGGGLHNGGILTMTRCTISGNAAFAGAGVYNYSGPTTITSSTISGNPAGSSGGGIDNISGAVNLQNTIVAQNTVPAGGTGPDLSGAFTSQGYNLIGTYLGSTGFSNGVNNDQVGGNPNPILNAMLGPLQDNGGPTQTRALLSGSSAIDKGYPGGNSTDQRGFIRPVDSPTIPNASGGDGTDIGAYEVQADQLAGCNTVVKNNNDSGTDSLRTIIANACTGSNITFAANVRGAINLTSGELAINKAMTINGPGAHLLSVQRSIGASNFRIFNNTGNYSVAISGLTIANGSGQLGGGIYNPGTLTLTGVTISGNAALNGGGIHNDFGTLAIIGSTLSGNTVSSNSVAGSGGAIFNRGGTVALTNSTVSGNSAIGPGGNSDSGGGIITNVGAVTLTNTTITGNSGDLGGGIRNINGGTVNSFNTIIALNTSPSGPDVNGPLTSQGFNLIGNSSGGTISPVQPADQIGVSAAQLNLGPLQDNGGPTFTHALLAGSFAIDKGSAGGSFSDQRGFLRPHDDPNITNASGGDGSDIGAFEFGAQSLRITSIARSGSDILITYDATSRNTYRLESKTGLTDAFWQRIEGLSDQTPSANGPATFTDPGALGLGKAFYRVTLLSSPGANLLVNGNAEAGTFSATGAAVFVPGWTTSSAFTVVDYKPAGDSSGFPKITDPGPGDRGHQFFAGGNAATSTATQTIDVSANAAAIDTGNAVIDLSGWLGGFGTDGDNALVSVAFFNGGTNLGGGGSIGPVLNTDRGNVTALLFRSQTIPVLPNTRQLVVTLTMNRSANTFNDGYADRLSLILRGP